jgi:hypothetical protein
MLTHSILSLHTTPVEIRLIEICFLIRFFQFCVLEPKLAFWLLDYLVIFVSLSSHLAIRETFFMINTIS